MVNKYKTTFEDLSDLSDMESQKGLSEILEQMFYCAAKILQNTQSETNFILKQNGEFDAIEKRDYYRSLVPVMRLASSHVDNPEIKPILGASLYMLAELEEENKKEKLYEGAIGTFEDGIADSRHVITEHNILFLGLANQGLANNIQDPTKRLNHYNESLKNLGEYMQIKKSVITYKDFFILAKAQLDIAKFLETHIPSYKAAIFNFQQSLDLKESPDTYYHLGIAQLGLSKKIPPEERAKLAKEGLKNIEKGTRIE
jgi:tetratricopeptide (TPR) repeat protein